MELPLDPQGLELQPARLQPASESANPEGGSIGWFDVETAEAAWQGLTQES